MPPKKQQPSKTPAKGKNPKASKSKEGKGKKKKWSKGKVRDKLENMCLFDEATYEKFTKEVPSYKLITPSVVSERLKIRASLARRALDELAKQVMKITKEYNILTDNVILVPYLDYHVSKYHGWMMDPVLLKETASEPLSLKELEWLLKEDRLTFIILDKTVYDSSAGSKESKEVESMVGDVNMYFESSYDNEDEMHAQITVMIADKQARRRGFASEAITCILAFADKILSKMSNDVQIVNVKVSKDNLASINLFKKLEFEEFQYLDAFDEVELRSKYQGIGALHSTCENLEKIMTSRDENFNVKIVDLK